MFPRPNIYSLSKTNTSEQRNLTKRLLIIIFNGTKQETNTKQNRTHIYQQHFGKNPDRLHSKWPTKKYITNFNSICYWNMIKWALFAVKSEISVKNRLLASVVTIMRLIFAAIVVNTCKISIVMNMCFQMKSKVILMPIRFVKWVIFYRVIRLPTIIRLNVANMHMREILMNIIWNLAWSTRWSYCGINSNNILHIAAF